MPKRMNDANYVEDIHILEASYSVHLYHCIPDFFFSCPTLEGYVYCPKLAFFFFLLFFLNFINHSDSYHYYYFSFLFIFSISFFLFNKDSSDSTAATKACFLFGFIPCLYL